MEDAKKAKRAQTAGGERSNEGDTAHNETIAKGSDEKTPKGSGVESPEVTTHRPAKKTKRSVADCSGAAVALASEEDVRLKARLELHELTNAFASLMPGTSTPAHGPTSPARRAAPASSVPDPQLRSATASRASTSLSVAEYHQEYRRRNGQRSMSRQQEESTAQSSSEPRAPPSGNDVLFSELEEGEVDYDEPMGSEDHSNPTFRGRTLPRNPAEAASLAAQQPLSTYTCGPAASTADEQVQRHRLRERYLTPQVTSPQEYQARLQMQLNRQPVPSIRTIPVVLNPGESQRAYEAQFRSWVEGARRLPSYNALRASFSETDIRLERCLRLGFAKSKARRRTLGPLPHHLEASPPLAHAASAAHSYEPAAPATGRSLSSATDLSSARSSGVKRSAPDDAVVRRSGGAVCVPNQKRLRRQGSPAGGQPQTPKRFVSEDNPSNSQGTEYDPGACASPPGVPHGSGARRARRAEQEEAEPQLDSRAASRSDVFALEQRVGSLNQYLHDTTDSLSRLAHGLDETNHRVDWFEQPQSAQNRVADLERQVAQLQGQIDLLLRLVAPPPAVAQPAVVRPPAVAQPVVAQPPLAPTPPRSPEQGPGTA
ncbi:hypothetical protein PInf_015071 [Phytophthora infestans]|nr:hypothetical protein PInf_015071 [Phytophthora infestans]